jgi:hypothetical protein
MADGKGRCGRARSERERVVVLADYRIRTANRQFGEPIGQVEGY